MTIANTILAQLGPRFKSMVGLRKPMALTRGLQFDFGAKASNKANRVQIVLAGSDLYTMAFYRQHGLDCDLIESVNGLFADQLTATFESRTAFRVSL